MMYGDPRSRATRVVFVQGSTDPWNTLGLKWHPNYSNDILIEGTSHCADIHSSYSSDPPQLSVARSNIVKDLKQFVIEEDDRLFVEIHPC
ncbi:putative serine protease K12H4.7 [Myzus persicae]|uniref:putative serine protease K12H4.7 n=1 Tax=Myzus persicae TaxID=13164 RepID=UPI000B933C34|nr:putative serine protease K12H4.7 [Myzus persicae]